MDKREKRRRQQKMRRLVIFLLLLAAAVGLGGFLLHGYIREKQEEERYESLRAQMATEAVTEEETKTLPETTVPERETIPETEEETESAAGLVFCDPVQDFTKLQEENEDIYAWILVPGTAVDYPVLQSETDNYYLDHNLDHSQGYPGCIYSNACNEQDFSDSHTVLYGHNLTRDRMFGSLHRFEDEEFFEENRQILIYRPDCRLTYEILAAVVYSDRSIPYYYNLYTYKGIEEFWESVVALEGEELTYILPGVELTEEDKLLTLSTCIRHVEGYRYLIVGRLTETALYYSDFLEEETTE